jgi:hypothetical protein
MISTRAMGRDSSASGTRKTSPETVVQDSDTSSNHKISGGGARPRQWPSANREGRGRAGPHGPPQSDKELQRTRATRLGPKREREQF